MGNGTVRQSKKSITLITSYQLSHRGSRSFTFASGWRLTFLSLWRLAVRRHSERRQKCRVGNLVNETVARSEESITLMTSYRFPHHNSRSFTSVQDDVLPFPILNAVAKMGNGTVRQSKKLLRWWRLAVRRHFERRQKCCVGNLVNGTVARSEESITLMTSYRFPHHNSRSFTSVQDDAYR